MSEDSNSSTAAKSGRDMPKMIVIGVLVLFVLFAAYKLLGSKPAAGDQPPAAQADTAQKIFSYEAQEAVGDKAAANQLFSAPIVAKSCPLGKCTSAIAIQGVEQQPTPKRGLNVYTITAEGQLVLLRVLDHCEDQKTFQSTEPLAKLVDRAVGASTVFLLAEDTANCNFVDGKKEGVEAWAQGYQLEKLPKLGIRNAYFAVIDTKAKKTVWEAASNDTIVFDSSKP